MDNIIVQLRLINSIEYVRAFKSFKTRKLQVNNFLEYLISKLGGEKVEDLTFKTTSGKLLYDLSSRRYNSPNIDNVSVKLSQTFSRQFM